MRTCFPMCVLLALTACGERVVITEYPVKQPKKDDVQECGDIKRLPGTSNPNTPEKTETKDAEDTEDTEESSIRYWSAYVYVDPHNIVSNWDEGSLSQIFVSAEVKIPTDGEPLVSDFPLFTAQDGSIQQHAGIDVLHKLPIMPEARSQVSITIKVRYLKNREALETARQILSVAEDIVKPLLDNYPAASQVLSAATGAIDDVVDQRKDQSPNSLTKYIIPEWLPTEVGQPLTVGLLFLTNEEIEAFSLDPTTDMHTNPARYPGGLTTCTDMPLALCRLETVDAEVSGDYCYQKVPVEVPYVTLTFRSYEEVYEPMLLVPGGFGTCSMLDEAAVDSVRKYLDANRALFHPDDVTQVESNIVAAERQLEARTLSANGDVLGMIEFLNRHGRPGWEPAARGEECWAPYEGPEDRVVKPKQGEPRTDRLLPVCTDLVADAWELWECEQEVWAPLPARDLLALWERAYDGKKTCGENQLPSACELGSVGQLLTNIFLALRVSVDLNVSHGELVKEKTFEQLEKDVFAAAPTLAHWYWRFRALQNELLQQIKIVDATELCKDPNRIAEQYTTIYCEACRDELQTLAKRCTSDWNAAADAKTSEFVERIGKSLRPPLRERSEKSERN